eukprot:358375-Chlamydomonas_euryale.AAC.4
MPPCRGSCCARLRLQSISQDATPSTLSGVTCLISFSASYGDAVISWTATEMATRQDRHVSAQLLRCCCKTRRIRDGKIAVALASASNGVGLTEGGSTPLLDRPCQDPCRGLCAQSDNSRVLCCNWHASTKKLMMDSSRPVVPHRGYRSAENLCTHGYTHMGVLLPGRQFLSGDILGTMTQLTQLDIMAEPDEDGHEEYSLTTFE